MTCYSTHFFGRNIKARSCRQGPGWFVDVEVLGDELKRPLSTWAVRDVLNIHLRERYKNTECPVNNHWVVKEAGMNREGDVYFQRFFVDPKKGGVK